jgi:hypothetical protein
MPHLRQIEIAHGLLAGLLAGIAVWFGGFQVAQSVLLGAALISCNVWLFKQLFTVVVRRRPARRRLAIALLFAKLPLLWGLLWLIARTGVVTLDGLGIAVGITCFPAAVVVVTLAQHTSRAEA